MPKALIRVRFASAIVRSDATGWNMPAEPDRLARLDAERHDVLDLEVDRVPNPDAVTQAVIVHLDRRPLDAEHLAHQRRQRPHRPAKLSAEHLDQLVGLLVGRLASMNTPKRQLPSVITFGVSAIAATFRPADIGAFDLTLADVEDEHHPAEVVRGAVVERQVARTQQIARARLDVAALEIPSHR